MDLEQFRKAMESDAAVENKKLKKELDDLKTRYEADRSNLEQTVKSLQDDCRVLANRCFAMTKGSLCIWCGLDRYKCPQSLSFDDKVRAVNKMREKGLDV